MKALYLVIQFSNVMYLRAMNPIILTIEYLYNKRQRVTFINLSQKKSKFL